MNDKELFWSLISPHLVDRPDATNRVGYGLGEALQSWYDLKRFVTWNHKFTIPPDLIWERNLPSAGYNYQSPTVKIPIDKHPNKMVILKITHTQKAYRLFFYFLNTIVEIRLTQMHNSETVYAMGGMEVCTKPVGDDSGWWYGADNSLPIFERGVYQYAVWPTIPVFINWTNDPFTLK